MFKFFAKLFGKVSPQETEANRTTLTWARRRMTQEQLDKGWGSLDATGRLPMYTQYFCSECGGELTPGPSGAGTNQVCEKCRINFGCLPGALER